ncbi:MAG: TonB-dependent receptor [Candidatus Sulfotelmatobacter sp.]
MLRFSCGFVGRLSFLLLLFSLVANFTWAQSETATVSGQVVDSTGLNIVSAQVKLVDIDRDTATSVSTNSGGLYTFPSVRPGRYRMEISAAGFRTVNVTGLTVNVQDHLEQNFKLKVGSVAESITVEGGAPLVNSESATISTVVDRQFAENLPMNGRSFQTLIELTPGVVLTTSSYASDGQFSINGQRPDSNYWMIDGVSANIGMSSNSAASDTLSGSLGGFSAQGGTNSLVSVDAMQEFRIQTSTFAPEFGRTPGGQISIVTRSGTNQFHGTAFDYFRNDALDASNWFNGFTNVPPLPKAEERQNDFGGTLGGPIIKNRTFFFFSYEGMRLRLPQTSLSVVPDASYTAGTTNSRQNTIPAMQPFINAFPLPSPNSPEILCNPITNFLCPASGETGSAALNASYSNRSSLDAASLRLDHRLNDKLTFFGRYNYSPSSLVVRPGPLAGDALSQLETIGMPTQTSTVGATWIPSPALTNDLRANYSRVDSSFAYTLDNFGGAIPFLSSAAGLPSPYTNQNSEVNIGVESLAQLFAGNGTTAQTQRQLNLVDSVSFQVASHTFKFGVDYRRLTPSVAIPAYEQGAGFLNVSQMETGTLVSAAVYSSSRVPLVLQNLGLFAQDTWRVRPRLTLTYGLRWDVDFSPRTSSGPSLPAATNFNNLATLGIAPPGTPVFRAQYSNIAPRVGVAYQLFQKKGWESVLRGGWGLFYDLATTQLQIEGVFYPFGSFNYVYGQYPLDPTSPTGGEPAPISPNNAILYTLDPQLKAPYTQEWNLAFEQSIGSAQSVSATYAGAAGRRLLITEAYSAPNANISYADLVGNYGSSDYDALQLQFRRRLSEGLQVLASYSWAHSIDTGSTGSGGLTLGDVYSRQLGASLNRGPSDFDIRNSVSAALTYDIPAADGNRLVQIFSQGWSTQNTLQARSATPVTVAFPAFTYQIGPTPAIIRPDVVPGQPFYLSEAQCLPVLLTQCPGGKGFNPAAFTPPPLDPTTGEPTRQGDLGRNALRGFGAWQWDFALHRDFPLREQIKLQFRVEMFNLLNHPNFGPPDGGLGSSYFGWSDQTLGQSLNTGNDGGGGFSTLYQLGGPRSVQLALKLNF